ncbi:NAD-dependent epimerase/dehydratase family protein [Actinocatenispora sera]|uniref:NAD-dependent epimerase/dehydratase family protein n=1 Tax=Actinocatenispora sera TaxID=390989 RepID=UPI0004C35CBA|nr:NAD(P)-dependent oxidoreductase [Actinocatenispora sera]
MTETVLVTGAAGTIGRLMRPRLARPGRVLRLLDRVEQPPAGPDEQVELVTASVTDPAAMTAACRGVAAVIHLGGISREAPWEQILAVNIDGTRTVLEAARLAGVRRVILASSNHAVGMRAVAEAGAAGVPGDATPRPDTYYGVSKAAMEALGSLYHDRFGLDVVCIRIGSCFPEPPGVRGLATWLSPDDGARLFEACLSAPSPGFRVVWGASANTRGHYSLAEARALGYSPRDDAERFAEKILAESSPAPGDELLGGGFTTTPVGEPNPL